jgi:ribosomal protein S6--L-glutamate ligase
MAWPFMRLVSFDALRSFGIPEVTYLHPQNLLQSLNLVEEADWLLFPEYDQLNILLYGLRKRIFPSPATYHLGHDKAQQTWAFQLVAPAHTPETLLLPRSDWALERIPEAFGYPFVAKEIRNSMGRGVFLIHNRTEWLAYGRSNPLLYAQELLPIDRDLRLVLIGRKVAASYWRLQSPDGFHNNVSQGGMVETGEVPPAAVDLVEQVAARLGIDHAGFDVAMVGDYPYLLEFNRLFGTSGLARMGVHVGPLIHAWLAEQTPLTPPVSPPCNHFPHRQAV